jgi:MFS family permease
MTLLAARPPFRFHRVWTILGILVVVQVVGQAISMSSGIMIPPLSDEDGGFGWDIRYIGGAIALYYLIGALASPVAGMLGDRYGARPIMFGCGVLYLASMLLVGIVREPWHFFIAFGVLLAITQAFTFVPLQASIGGWFRRRLGFGTGILQAAGGIGAAAIAPGIAELLGFAGWRDTFWLIGIAGGGLIILCSIFFRSRPADVNINPYGIRGEDPPEITPPKELLMLRLKVFGQHMRRTRAFWNLPTIHGLGCAGHGIVLIFVVNFAVKEIGISLTQAAGILSFISIFSIVGRFVVPMLAEHLGGKPVMMVALFLQGVTVVVLFYANDLWAFYLFGVLFGLGFGGEMSAYLVVNRQYFGTGPMATLYGWEIMGAMMGHAIATILGGLVISLIGYLPVFALSMGFSIIGVTVILTLESTKRVLIPDWEDSLPPEARSEALFRPPSEPRPAPPPGALPEATPGD